MDLVSYLVNSCMAKNKEAIEASGFTGGAHYV